MRDVPVPALGRPTPGDHDEQEDIMSNELSVTSEDFTEGATIPQACAHQMAGGENRSPSLRWSGAPEGTASFAVTCYDPDAPTTVGFVHWVVGNIPAEVTELAPGAGTSESLPAGAVSGFTDWGVSAYGGMAPPEGDEPHHYRFTVLALDVANLDIAETTTLAMLRFSTLGHVLAEGTLTGRYGR
jgi:Raf kinase inhibitor-like YbhB/YbcL family protein